MYYNTNDETGEGLQHSRQNSERQMDVVYRVFESNPNMTLTPFEISTATGQNWPITSIRRAITDLTNAGKLEKTEEKRMGPYGKQTYCWKYVS